MKPVFMLYQVLEVYSHGLNVNIYTKRWYFELI